MSQKGKSMKKIIGGKRTTQRPQHVMAAMNTLIGVITNASLRSYIRKQQVNSIFMQQEDR